MLGEGKRGEKKEKKKKTGPSIVGALSSNFRRKVKTEMRGKKKKKRVPGPTVCRFSLYHIQTLPKEVGRGGDEKEEGRRKKKKEERKREYPPAKI